MTKVYQVRKYSDAIHSKEDLTFSSFSKALQYISVQLNGITIIKDEPEGKYWEGTWYYKKYTNEVSWSELLISRENMGNRKYMGNESLYIYTIRPIEVR